MILDTSRSFCFIHIPRCGGISITTALAAVCPDAQVEVWDADRHRLARNVAVAEPDWPGLFRFAVIRNPWDVCESDWRLTIADYPKLEELRGGWRERVLRAHEEPSFAGFVRREWLGEHGGVEEGGLWRTWCLGEDGESLGVCAVAFPSLNEQWPEVCRRIGVSVPLPQTNAATGPRADWTPELLDAVGRLCRDDLDVLRMAQLEPLRVI